MTDVINNMDAWIDKVNVALGKDKEWIGLNQLILKDRSFNDIAITILKRIILDLIPQGYRTQNFIVNNNSDNGQNDKTGYNPNLDALIDGFDLVPDEAPF